MPIRKNKFADAYPIDDLVNYYFGSSAKDFDENYIQEKTTARKAHNNHIDPRLYYYASGCDDSLRLLMAMYFRGDSLTTIKAAYDTTIERFHIMHKTRQSFELDTSEARSLTEEGATGFFVALGHALGLSRQEIAFNTQPIPAGYDRFTDRLLSIYDPQRSIAPKLYHNSLYKKLYSVFDAPPQKRPTIIARFLDNWEKFLLKEDIPMMSLGKHERPDSGWTGYWCYPAAAVVAALNIDDSTFIDHEFYPTDLMRACAPYREDPIIVSPIVDAPEPLPAAPKRKPKRQPAPALLIPFAEVFDQLTATLPESLQNTVWNQMVTWLKEEYEGDSLDAIDFIYALNGGEVGSELNSRYKRTLILHVDWKDDESALHFTQQMARTVGIDPLFEPDPLSLNAPERVWEVLSVFNTWLTPQGWCVLPLNLGDDAYHACLVSLQSEEEIRTLLASKGFRLQSFETGKPF